MAPTNRGVGGGTAVVVAAMILVVAMGVSLVAGQMPDEYLEADTTVGREHIPWLHQEIRYVV